jgi:osmoprotectant transport system ATP-binding protein
VVFVTHDVDEAVRLGDRIAILATGGVLAQHDRPADILARPASTFVAEFVGDDRGLTRLALLPVSSADPIPLEEAVRRFPLQLDESGRPVDGSAVAGPDSTLKDALARTLVHDGWVIVTDRDGRAAGVLTATGIVGAGLTSAAGEARRPAPSDAPIRR